jgi:shikimate kinase
MIRLVGPGGAGKSTTGALLAKRLGVPFVDLDQQFKATVGNISKFIDTHGYDAYAARNVSVYTNMLVGATDQRGVLAFSSGFMTYREDIHQDYAGHRRDIATDPSTFVLLPTLEFESCIAEIVRRQIGRPFRRSVEREEQVIRARFAVHRDIPAKKVETMRPVAEVVDELLVAIAAQQSAAPDAAWRRDYDATRRG